MFAESQQSHTLLKKRLCFTLYQLNANNNFISILSPGPLQTQGVWWKAAVLNSATLSILVLLWEKHILQWRHNGRDSLSNHQPHHCLLNRLFRRRSKKHQSSAPRRIHRGPVNSPHKWPVKRKMFPFDDVMNWSPPCGWCGFLRAFNKIASFSQ